MQVQWMKLLKLGMLSNRNTTPRSNIVFWQPDAEHVHVLCMGMHPGGSEDNHIENQRRDVTEKKSHIIIHLIRCDQAHCSYVEQVTDYLN